MSNLGRDLIESLSEAVAHAKREPSGVVTRTIEVPDVRVLRRRLGMSQEKFAAAYRIPLPTLRNWEQGRRHPDAPAAAFLQVIARRRRETLDTLQG